ncbi:MAG: hypothetical protein ACI4GY_08665 [Acutalibacteraceae bacterium]
MKTTYEDLYSEYLRAIKVQKSIISRNNALLSAARKDCNFKEIKRLNGLLLILYEEKSELEERAQGLLQYIS